MSDRPETGVAKGAATRTGGSRSPSRLSVLALIVTAGPLLADPLVDGGSVTVHAPEALVIAAADADAVAASASTASPLDLSAHAGKIVYVDFWASWCTPCRASFPWMNELQRELGDEEFVVLGVNTGDDPEAAARFLEEVPAEFEIVYDTDGSIAQAYGLQGMPMAYVHGRSGEPIDSHVGFNDELAEERAEKLRALVAADR